MTQNVKIAGVQMDVTLGEVQTNLDRIDQKLQETSAAEASITVFPECALTGYGFDSLEEARPCAETLPGPSTQRIAETCREYNSFAIYGLLELDGERLFNACVLVGPDGVVGSYRKVHLPFLGIDRFVTPGDRPFEIHTAGDVRVGMNICYDGSFPESARVMALAGADLIALPTNWPPGAHTFADYAINCRAMENCVYYIAVDRVGTERGFPFIGKSRICETDGRDLAFAPGDDETILYAEIDLARARNKHLVRIPNKHEIHRFADRRPEMYKAITDPVREEHVRTRQRPGDES